MRKINLNFLLLIFVFFACSKENTFRGSGNIITQRRDVGSFTKVHTATSVNITIIEGSSQSMEVVADDNLMNKVKTIVEGGALKIDLSTGNYVDTTIMVSIVMPNLEALENAGSGNITVSGFEDLTSLSIDNKGSGNVMMSGSGDALSIKNSGSGSYSGFSFGVQNCTVANSGSGNCEINCSGSLSGSNSGSGGIFHKGTSSVDIENIGSGQVVNSN